MSWLFEKLFGKEELPLEDIAHDTSYLDINNQIAPHIQSTYSNKNPAGKSKLTDFPKQLRSDVKNFFIKEGMYVGLKLKNIVADVDGKMITDIVNGINEEFKNKFNEYFSDSNIELHTKKELREMRKNDLELDHTKNHIIIDVDGGYNLLRKDKRYGIILSFVQSIDGTHQGAVGAYVIPEANIVVYGSLDEASMIQSKKNTYRAIIPSRTHFYGNKNDISIERKQPRFTLKFRNQYTDAIKIFKKVEQTYPSSTENKQYSIGHSLMQMMGGWGRSEFSENLGVDKGNIVNGLMVMRSALWESGLITIARGAGGEAHYLRNEDDLISPVKVAANIQTPWSYFPIVITPNEVEFRDGLFKKILELYKDGQKDLNTIK